MGSAALDSNPGLPNGGTAPYTQFFNERVAEVMHARMTNIFTHPNPYTGKRYCDDPTLALVEVPNEDSLFWGSIALPFGTELEDKFAVLRKAGIKVPISATSARTGPKPSVAVPSTCSGIRRKFCSSRRPA